MRAIDVSCRFLLEPGSGVLGPQGVIVQLVAGRHVQQDTGMSDPIPEKTPVEKMREVNSKLKEMEHYSRNNIEKLSASWLLLDEELKEKGFAERVNDLLSTQNTFQDRVTELSTDLEAECVRLEQDKA